MSLVPKTEDVNTLPTAMLGLAKQQMRIDWAYDDDFIKACVARAIGKFQQINEVTVNPSTFDWTPDATAFVTNGEGGPRATLPVRPVSSFEAKDAADADVSADYAVVLKWDSPYGVPIQVFAGAQASGLKVTLTAGYAALAQMPQGVVDALLRLAAHLYEHREILIPDTEFVAPDVRTDATWWMPRI